MSTTRIVDIAALPGAREADERAAELALRLPGELAPLAPRCVQLRRHLEAFRHGNEEKAAARR